jgi:hypothetical protein
LAERLGEAVRADDHRRVVAPRLDVQHQVAVLENGETERPADGRKFRDAVVAGLWARDAYADLMRGWPP